MSIKTLLTKLAENGFVDGPGNQVTAGLIAATGIIECTMAEANKTLIDTIEDHPFLRDLQTGTVCNCKAIIEIHHGVHVPTIVVENPNVAGTETFGLADFTARFVKP